MPGSDKRDLRNSYLKMRKALSKESVEQKSFHINQNILQILDSNARILMFYVPINNEVDILPLLNDMYNSGKIILLPRLVEGEIVPYIIHDLEFDLVPGAYNIPEPATQPYHGEIDTILVPGIVFDKRGYRIGYGKGYFDKFLHEKKADQVIGVAYDFQVVDKIPHEPHDFMLDNLATTTNIYSFR